MRPLGPNPAAAGRGGGGAAPRRVSILGATGSIGRSTIDLVARGGDAYQVEALIAGRNARLLADQARRLGARCAVVGEEDAYGELKQALAGTWIEAGAGAAAVAEAAGRPVDWVMAGIVGAAGLGPTLEAVRQGAVVALANKESLVCAGEIVLAEAARCGATVLPVDSEHSAIFQAMGGGGRDRIEKIALTASGGPFRTASRERMETATPADALAHPNWKMGRKISIDSATMMNKGLELVEACFLFGMPESRIDVLVHPQSIVHGLVHYVDGSVLAQLGAPDMRTPISCALAWPDRIPTPSARLDLAGIGVLSFEPPDEDRFPALRLAREALRDGGGAPTVLNAANETAVAGFLSGRIGFRDIARVVAATLERVRRPRPATLEDVGSLDEESRAAAAGEMMRLEGADGRGTGGA